MSGTVSVSVYELVNSNLKCTEFPCERVAAFKVDRSFATPTEPLVEFHSDFPCELHLASCIRNHATACADRLLVAGRHTDVRSTP